MPFLNKYNLYNSDGRKMFTVIPGENSNTLLGMPQTLFFRQEYLLTDSQLRQFKADKELLLEQELGTQLSIFDI